MQDGLLHPQLAEARGELQVAAGVCRDEDIGAGGLDMGEFPFEQLSTRIDLLQSERPGHTAAPVRFLHLPEFDPGDLSDDLAGRTGKALTVDQVTGFMVGDGQRHRLEFFGADSHFDEEFGDVADLRPETDQPFVLRPSFE